ncbi:MAG TPA: Calx-beta domain-containing protein, partial [Tepidisphaeraceae bacterium]|nr:Calx-beta domain-containing protein [Tepidisphaeraceae bacterium]
NVATFTVQMRMPAATYVNVSYATANGTATAGSDYQSRGGSFQLRGHPSQNGVDDSYTFTVPLVGDGVIEADETFLVNFSTVDQDDSTGSFQAVATIRNDDRVNVTVSNATVSEEIPAERARALTFNVNLSRPLSAGEAAVPVQYATADGTATAGADYVATSGTVIFAPGGAATQTVVVPVLQDGLYEPSETVLLNLGTTSNAANITDAQGVGTITNTDVGVSVGDATAAQEGSAPGTGGTLTFPVTITRTLAAGEGPLRVGYITSDGPGPGVAEDGPDYRGTAGVLTFTGGGPRTQNVVVQVKPDYEDEAAVENLRLTLSEPQGLTIVDGAGAGAVNDDDAPGAAWIPVDGGTVLERTGQVRQALFVVQAQDVRWNLRSQTITYQTAPNTATAGVDYESVSGLVEFPEPEPFPAPFPAPGDNVFPLPPDGRIERDLSQRFVVHVPVIGDSLAESTESFYLVLRNAAGVEIGRGEAFILDDDAPGGMEQPDEPGAWFDYRMPDRFGDHDGNGVVDMPLTAAYSGVDLFRVELDGRYSRGADMGPASSFNWLIDGANLAAPVTLTGATPSVDLPEGQYSVTLDVVGGDRSRYTTTQAVKVNDILIVSLGESAASGEGNPAVPRVYDDAGNLLEEDVWADAWWGGSRDENAMRAHRRHHRTPLAGAAQAALALEKADPRSSVTFVSLAQSGAEVFSGLLAPKGSPAEGQPGDPSGYDGPQVDQADQLVGSRTVDFLTLSMGGNDVGFSDILSLLVLADLPTFILTGGFIAGPTGLFAGAASYYGLLEDTFSDAEAKLQVLRQDRYPAINPAFTEHGLNGGRVLITEYFDPTRDASGDFADEIMGDIQWPFEADEDELAEAYDRVLNPLNQAVEEAAAANGWTFVGGIASAFSTHGYSAHDNFVRTNSESLVVQGPDMSAPFFIEQGLSRGTMHPNVKGHQVYAQKLLAEMKASPADPEVATVSISDATVVEGDAGAPYLSFTLTLSQALSREVTLRYATADGTATAGADYAARQGFVRFAPGTTSLALRVPVTPDDADEGPETVVVSLTDFHGALPSGADAQGVGTIANDDGTSSNLHPIAGR